jgi:hypothetical protein
MATNDVYLDILSTPIADLMTKYQIRYYKAKDEMEACMDAISFLSGLKNLDAAGQEGQKQSIRRIASGVLSPFVEVLPD